MLSTDNNKNELPLIVVMGVAGSGKSTIASGLAEKLGVDFIEGDALHPQANVNKMAGGLPLTDEDRWPWLEAIGARIDAERAAGMGVVVSCSALKHVYRDCLRKKVQGRVRFILLDGPRDLISKRIQGRKGHFMPQSLLDSQLATLEPPGDDEHVLACDLALEPQAIVQRAAAWLGGPETATAGADKGKPT